MLPITVQLVRLWFQQSPIQRGKLRLVRWAANRFLSSGVQHQIAKLHRGFELECDLTNLDQ